MVAAESSKPHVALLPNPGLGHVIPFFELAHRLVTHHNFHVSFLVITTTSTSAAQRHLLHSPPADLHVIHLPPAEVSHAITEDMQLLARICHIVDHSIRSSLRSILSELNRPNALIIDMFCTQAIDICEELEVPVYSFMPPAAATTLFLLYLPTLDREVEGEFVDLLEPVQVPGCRPIRTEDLLDSAKNRKTNEYKWLLFHATRLREVAGILLNTWEDFEPVCIRAVKENRYYHDIRIPPVYPIGPVIRQDEPIRESHVEILKWLDNQPPASVLFIALGSGGNLSTQQLTELALGLEMSQQRFIMVARKPHDAGAWSSFFDVGNGEDDPVAYLPKEFIKRVEGVGLVVSEWTPQMPVLCHVSTGGFLSHCGWNSTLESISCGVPMIAWPLYAEQRMNATVLADEVGVAVKPKTATLEDGKGIMVEREEVARVVRVVMGGGEGNTIRSRARELQESAKKALEFGGSSYEALSRVVEVWKSDHYYSKD